jgi:hypothetical protein
MQKAGTVNADGFIEIELDGEKYLAQDLAYFLMTKQWPHRRVIHIDGNKTNNAWVNLKLEDVA